MAIHKCGQGIELNCTAKHFHLLVKGALKTGISGRQVQRPNHLAALPPMNLASLKCFFPMYCQELLHLQYASIALCLSIEGDSYLCIILSFSDSSRISRRTPISAVTFKEGIHIILSTRWPSFSAALSETITQLTQATAQSCHFTSI